MADNIKVPTKKKGAKVAATLKLIIPAGKANPSPPVGPALGQRGVNIMEFVKAFNARTEELIKKGELKAGTPVPAIITVYTDRSFDFVVTQPPASVLLRDEAGIAKGSSTPNTVKVAKLGRLQLEKIAKAKMSDLSAADIEAAIRTLAGTARSMGIDVEGVKDAS